MRETIGIEPETVIREGGATDQIYSLIEEDRDIAILVLAAGSAKDGPGPLVLVDCRQDRSIPDPGDGDPGFADGREIDALS